MALASDPEQLGVLNMVYKLARDAGLAAMPEVGIYDSPELNAFATGPSRSRALVAISSGLLRSMSRSEVEGVVGHEITHVANGDEDDRGSRTSSPMMEYMVRQLLQIAFGMLGMIVVAWFSRWREYRADAGGARLAGAGNMIGALRALQRGLEGIGVEQKGSLAALKIAQRPELFSTHPPLEARIARLEASA